MTLFNARFTLGRWAVDQLLHFLWAALALTPMAIIGPTWWSGTLSGLLIALPRELVDQWPVNHPLDTALDLAFFAAGGTVIGAVAAG